MLEPQRMRSAGASGDDSALGDDSTLLLQVSQELKATVNRLYVDTTQKLDSALQNICSDFNPAAYGKVCPGSVCSCINVYKHAPCIS
jgi:hypothetical protein